ncbi:hypothetical protein D515_01646 [Grimontia indica]|uniref:Uncharacterized protein n=1 Tax=Grimontia indica TaxID=1056512 RepID=R1H029_9GAMM|nr:hypothetical protein D515_01646 [Grimontia indica]
MEFNEEVGALMASLRASRLTPCSLLFLFDGDDYTYKGTPRSQRQSISLNPASSGCLGIYPEISDLQI